MCPRKGIVHPEILYGHCSCLQGLEREMPKRVSQLNKRDRQTEDGVMALPACLNGMPPKATLTSVIAGQWLPEWTAERALGQEEQERFHTPTRTTPHTSWVAFPVSYILDEVITDKKSQGIFLQTRTSSLSIRTQKAHFPAQSALRERVCRR